MVATDVASRGIGMIETPFPCTATASRLHSSALLSTLTRSPDCVNLPGLFRVFWFSFIGCLGSSVKHHSCCTCNSKLKKYFFRYEMWNWHLLTCQAVSKTPKLEDLDVLFTCPGNAPAMDR